MTMFEDVKIALQYLLPGHLLSRTVGQLALCEIPAVKNRLIHLAIQRFKIDLADAEISDPEGYPHFNAFFTRALKANARTLAGADAYTKLDTSLKMARYVPKDMNSPSTVY
jgi:phosphatidylserine decarboxylase